MKRLILTVLTALTLTACAANPYADPPPGDNADTMLVTGKIATQAERQRCERLGGTIERAGMLGYERCTRPYADGGTQCRDSAVCDGKCLYRQDYSPGRTQVTGQCQIDDNPFGCYGEVKNGTAQAMLCID